MGHGAPTGNIPPLLYSLLKFSVQAGQERFRTITSSYYRGCHGIMYAQSWHYLCSQRNSNGLLRIFFDLTSEPSFTDAEGWRCEIGKYTTDEVCLILVGAKAVTSHWVQRILIPVLQIWTNRWLWIGFGLSESCRSSPNYRVFRGTQFSLCRMLCVNWSWLRFGGSDSNQKHPPQTALINTDPKIGDVKKTRW